MYKAVDQSKELVADYPNEQLALPIYMKLLLNLDLAAKAAKI